MARILVVDDDLIVQRVLGMTLQRGGYTVLSARDGAEAVRTLEGESVDLIITDLSMPDVSGIDLLRHIRAHQTWRNIPVAILTASPEGMDAARARGEGVDAVLTKPTGSRELLDTVQHLLGGD